MISVKTIFQFTAATFLLSLTLLAPSTHATTFTAVPISSAIPGVPGSNGSSNCTPDATTGQPPSGCNPAGYVNDFYSFALAISGILAFGAMIYGGVKYMLAAGNPSAQHEGKEWVQSALLGLLLLAGAYLILNTINPALTTLSLPTLTPVTATTNPATPNPTQ